MKMRNHKKYFQRMLAVSSAAMLTLLLTACAEKKVEIVHTSDEQEVQVTKVVEGTLNRLDKFPGEIQAYQDVAVYPKVPGFIQEIYVDRGSKVKKGQLMVKLIAPELQAQANEYSSKTKAVQGQLAEAKSKVSAARASLLEAQAQLAGDTDTYTRTKEASAVPGVVAPNDVVVLGQKVAADSEKVRVWKENIDSAEQAVKSLEESVVASKNATNSYRDIADYLNVYAPFDGYVTERNMHVGSFVGPLGKGAYPPIVRVQQLDLLRIVTPVPEANVSGVEPGAPVQFTVSTHPGERFTGTVARIGNYLDQKTRTMPVELNYENPGWRILPGMFCDVYWPTRRTHPSLFLPPTAVDTTSTLETFVCRVNNDETEWVPVNRGEMMDGLTEVFGNLKAGDVVALRCTDALKPHTRVKTIMTEVKDLPKVAAERPAYNTHGTIYAIPDAERKSLEAPENKDKPRAY